MNKNKENRKNRTTIHVSMALEYSIRNHHWGSCVWCLFPFQEHFRTPNKYFSNEMEKIICNLLLPCSFFLWLNVYRTFVIFRCCCSICFRFHIGNTSRTFRSLCAITVFTFIHIFNLRCKVSYPYTRIPTTSLLNEWR